MYCKLSLSYYFTLIYIVFKHSNYFCYYLINIIILRPKFLQKQKKPKLFWVSAIAPMVVVVVGCLFAYLIRGKDYGIQTVSALSSMSFNFFFGES